MIHSQRSCKNIFSVLVSLSRDRRNTYPWDRKDKHCHVESPFCCNSTSSITEMFVFEVYVSSETMVLCCQSLSKNSVLQSSCTSDIWNSLRCYVNKILNTYILLPILKLTCINYKLCQNSSERRWEILLRANVIKL